MYIMNRCLYGCINFVRLLHKLTKGNVTRLSVIISYRVHVMMKRILKLQQDDLVLYVAKILKSILRAVGRKWRSSNMKMYSLVYKVCTACFRVRSEQGRKLVVWRP